MPELTFDAWQMQSWCRPGSEPGSQHRQRIHENPPLSGSPKRSAEQIFAGYDCISYNGSRKHQNSGPTYVPIPKGEGGLPKDSLAVCHHLRTVDESRLGKVYGQIKPETMRQVAAALKIVLDLQEE